MADNELQVVTGAFSYQGSYIAERLLERGIRVRTLTGHPERPHPLRERIEALPYRFDDPAALARSLEGATVLYNTYWVRFNYGVVTYDRAVANSRLLIEAARQAGVKKIVHTSITNPAEDSPFPYFRGKALVERAILESGLGYAILRPTVLFGKEDILINNITWLLRRSPVFALFGDGEYPIQPVFVGDLADLAVAQGAAQENVIMDAVGPQIYTFATLVRIIRKELGKRTLLVPVPPWLGLLFGRAISPLLGDVLITRDEIGGLMAGLLVSRKKSTCTTRFSLWLQDHIKFLGVHYASELARHYR